MSKLKQSMLKEYHAVNNLRPTLVIMMCEQLYGKSVEDNQPLSKAQIEMIKRTGNALILIKDWAGVAFEFEESTKDFLNKAKSIGTHFNNDASKRVMKIAHQIQQTDENMQPSLSNFVVNSKGQFAGATHSDFNKISFHQLSVDLQKLSNIHLSIANKYLELFHHTIIEDVNNLNSVVHVLD